MYLGVELDSAVMRARLSQQRMETLWSLLRRCSPGSVVTALSVMRPLELLHMRRLQRWFSRLRIDPVRQRLRKVTIPLSVGPDLTHWGDPQTLARGGACAPSITAMLSSCAERTPPWRFMYAAVALLSVRIITC